MINMLPNRLRLLRKESKLTQKLLALDIRVPRVTYTHYERGTRTPDIETLTKIARYYHVSVDFLIGNTPLRPSLEQWLKDHGCSTDDIDKNIVYPLIHEVGERVADQNYMDDDSEHP